MAKKYPVGTQIKYIGNCNKCKGKTGKIVGVGENTCEITLPQSSCGVFHYDNKMRCVWNHIEPLVIKGQQLLFSFMSEDNGN